MEKIKIKAVGINPHLPLKNLRFKRGVPEIDVNWAHSPLFTRLDDVWRIGIADMREMSLRVHNEN